MLLRPVTVADTGTPLVPLPIGCKGVTVAAGLGVRGGVEAERGFHRGTPFGLTLPLSVAVVAVIDVASSVVAVGTVTTPVVPVVKLRIAPSAPPPALLDATSK